MVDTNNYPGNGEIQKRLERGQCPKCKSIIDEQKSDEVKCQICNLIIDNNWKTYK